eukprot:TRINITY_DN3211_c0_g1_i1.p1 TRINITY_DN3211_c0_g1~~TRINITY_DN3211_c0_g1_i1.p1  ORF type:complete len:389 (-),score=50.23 TRINITY_DN3211_c0_g1_i1:6-1151(-)
MAVQSLVSLPVDGLQHALGFVDFPCLLTLRAVSVTFRDAVTPLPSWQALLFARNHRPACLPLFPHSPGDVPSVCDEEAVPYYCFTARPKELELLADCACWEKLRGLAWTGITPRMRPYFWRAMLGVQPGEVEGYLDDLEMPDSVTLKQIRLDVVRTRTARPLVEIPLLQALITRVCYRWSDANGGYMSGMSDVVAPLMVAFLSEHLVGDILNAACSTVEALPKTCLAAVEAHTYRGATKLGVLRRGQQNAVEALDSMRSLLTRLDPPLARHFDQLGITPSLFAYSWVTCFMAHSLPLPLLLRLWDTIFAEREEDMIGFHLCFCTACVVRHSSALQRATFEHALITVLPGCVPQSLRDLEELLATAHVMREQYFNSPHHWKS